MGWCSLVLVLVVLMHHATLKPNPLDELTVNLNLDDATNGGHTLESPEIESEEWKAGKTTSKGSSCKKKRKRILGGKRYIPGEIEGVPDYQNWMASIKIKKKDFYSNCGGVLISKKHVLTALHCIFDRIAKKFHKTSKVKIYFDPNKLELHGGTKFKADKYFFEKGQNKMPEYMPNTTDILRDDIAVIKLHKAITKYPSTANLQPLPISEFPGTQVFTTRGICELWWAGWGTHELPDKIPQFLQYTKYTVTEYMRCPEDGKNRQDTMMCFLGTNKKSLCEGDSGGPGVISVNENSWAVQSIHSRGSCEFNSDPVSITVTTDVYPYRDRIAEWINKKN